MNKTHKLKPPKPPRAYANAFARLDHALTQPRTPSVATRRANLNQAYRRIFGMVEQEPPTP